MGGVRCSCWTTAPEAGAMLLERLDGRRTLREVDLTQALAIAGGLLRRLAMPAPPGFRHLATVAEDLGCTLPLRWSLHQRSMPQSQIKYACDLARQLGPSAGNLLVNYDLHYDNVLAGEREPWLAVDPKVVAGDLEYGLAQLLWCRLEEIEAQGGLERHFKALAEAAEVDPELAREVDHRALCRLLAMGSERRFDGRSGALRTDCRATDVETASGRVATGVSGTHAGGNRSLDTGRRRAPCTSGGPCLPLLAVTPQMGDNQRTLSHFKRRDWP